MRTIHKQAEPVEFSQWKSANPTATYKDLSQTRFQGGNAKRALRASLLAEQHGLCCYCERSISGGDFHIEHFRPKGDPRFSCLQLEYGNLHVSCRKESCGYEDTCGHHKDDDWSPWLVSPLEADCETHFSYGLDGRIMSGDLKGNASIEILALDSQALTASRKALIDYFLFELPEDEVEEELDRHLDLTRPVYGEFHSMIVSLRGALLARPVDPFRQ